MIPLSMPGYISIGSSWIKYLLIFQLISLPPHLHWLDMWLVWAFSFVDCVTTNLFRYFLSTKPFKASLLRRFVNNVLHSSSVQGCLLVYLRVSVSLWTPSRILLLSDQPCTKFGRTVLNSDPTDNNGGGSCGLTYK